MFLHLHVDFIATQRVTNAGHVLIKAVAGNSLTVYSVSMIIRLGE